MLGLMAYDKSLLGVRAYIKSTFFCFAMLTIRGPSKYASLFWPLAGIGLTDLSLQVVHLQRTQLFRFADLK